MRRRHKVQESLICAYISLTLASSDSRSHQLLLLTWLVLHDISRHRARGDGERRSQIHLSRTAAPRKVAVLRADHHLIGTRRNSRPRVDAGSATGLDHDRAGFLKHIDIALAQAILTRLLRSKLNVELNRIRHAL